MRVRELCQRVSVWLLHLGHPGLELLPKLVSFSSSQALPRKTRFGVQCKYPDDVTRVGSRLAQCFVLGRFRVPQGRGVREMSCPVNGPPLHSHLPRSGKRTALVEHYGLGVLVCHLGHMTEDIFFCNNTKEASVKRETERIYQCIFDMFAEH